MSNSDFEPVDYIIKLIKHGTIHMEKGTPFDLHIAMINIDNAVELCIRTYLNIDYFIKFPKLIEIFREKAPQHITKEMTDNIARFHTKRNGVYHSIKKKPIMYDIIFAYTSIARILLSKLFERPVKPFLTNLGKNAQLIEQFYEYWDKVYERLVRFYFDVTDILDPSVDEFKESLELTNYCKIIEYNDVRLLQKIERFADDIINREEVPSTEDLQKFTQYLIEIYPRFKDKISEYYDYEKTYYEPRKEF